MHQGVKSRTPVKTKTYKTGLSQDNQWQNSGDCCFRLPLLKPAHARSPAYPTGKGGHRAGWQQSLPSWPQTLRLLPLQQFVSTPRGLPKACEDGRCPSGDSEWLCLRDPSSHPSTLPGGPDTPWGLLGWLAFLTNWDIYPERAVYIYLIIQNI